MAGQRGGARGWVETGTPEALQGSDIARELNEIFLRHDLLQYRTFGYGHSFGTLSHYYGREAGLELREDIDTVLEPGMVVSIEPMISPKGDRAWRVPRA